MIILLKKHVSSFCICSENINVFENTLATIVKEFVINESMNSLS